MSNDLVKRLRDGNHHVLDEDAHDAADRIEELEAALRPLADARETGRINEYIDRARAVLYGTPGEQPSVKRMEIDEAPEA